MFTFGEVEIHDRLLDIQERFLAGNIFFIFLFIGMLAGGFIIIKLFTKQ